MGWRDLERPARERHACRKRVPGSRVSGLWFRFSHGRHTVWSKYFTLIRGAHCKVCTAYSLISPVYSLRGRVDDASMREGAGDVSDLGGLRSNLHSNWVW